MNQSLHFSGCAEGTRFFFDEKETRAFHTICKNILRQMLSESNSPYRARRDADGRPGCEGRLVPLKR